jgi:chromatin structure-remodeling complex subunit RSC1/2
MQQGQSSYTSQQQQPGTAAAASSTYAPRPPTATGSSYREGPAIETYILPDQANLSIPLEIRERYQRDELGRVIFFTAPPVIPSEPTGGVKAHSVRYLAAKARREASLAQKRTATDLDKLASERAIKQARIEQVQQASRDVSVSWKLSLRRLRCESWTMTVSPVWPKGSERLPGST